MCIRGHAVVRAWKPCISSLGHCVQCVLMSLAAHCRTFTEDLAREKLQHAMSTHGKIARPKKVRSPPICMACDILQPPTEGAGTAPAPFAAGLSCAGPSVAHMNKPNMQGTVPAGTAKRACNAHAACTASTAEQCNAAMFHVLPAIMCLPPDKRQPAAHIEACAATLC